jgi:uncharacterized protein (TIGR02145 family)
MYLLKNKTMKKVTLIILGLIISICAFSQDYEVTFAAFGIASEVDSVQIENISQGKSISVAGTDVLHLLGIVNEIENSSANQQLSVYPNPAGDYANVSFYANASELVEIRIFDISGKLIEKQSKNVNQGANSFRLSGLRQGMYIVSINSENYSHNANLVITGSGSDRVNIHAENDGVMFQKSTNSSKSVIQWQYNEEDILIFKGFSGGHSRIYVYYVASDAIVNFEFVLCQDADGAKYSVVGIGAEIYMAENLRTTKYNNGIPIDKVEASVGWADLIEGSYCYYDNDSATHAVVYGALYNFAAVNTGNLCPNGWHVPSVIEWQDLLIFLQNNGYNYDGMIDSDNDFSTNNKIAKSLCTTSDWITSDVIGVPGNDDYPAFRNRSGFSANPAGGFNHTIGSTTNINLSSCWWTSTEYSPENSKRVFIINNQEAVQILTGTKTFGYSVRCIKD